LLVVHTVAATVMKIICPYVVLVELLGPGNLVDDGPCSGLSWTLLAAPFLRDVSAVEAVLDRSYGTDFDRRSPGHGVGGCCVARRLRSGRHVPPKEHRSKHDGFLQRSPKY
jgi:hypothetical protein